MAEEKMVMFELRNGEHRVYQGVTRVDDSRRHLVLVYVDDRVIAQLNKHDVLNWSFQVPQPVAQVSAEAAEADEDEAGED
jgi:hypothetical protein